MIKATFKLHPDGGGVLTRVIGNLIVEFEEFFCSSIPANHETTFTEAGQKLITGGKNSDLMF